MRSAVIARVTALAVVLAAAGCTSTSPRRPAASSSASAARGGFQAGAAGIGDPYFPEYGNGGYDVGHYTIKIKYDPATDELTGDVTINATATTSLSQFDLDFAGLTVRSVTVNGASSRHRRAGDELIITPAAGLGKGADFTTEIRYDGRPGALGRPGLGASGFLHTTDGAVVIGEPESATTWYPVNDHPQDKATYTIEITAPAGLAVVSNGVLERTATTGGQSTTTWQMRSPMASYLSTLAIGRYRIKTGTHHGKPVLTAVAQSLPVGAADAAMARTTEIADFLATQFGPYPFDAYGGIVIDEDRIGFALETQTRPIYSAKFFAAGENSRVVAHELAHQWFGDSVSVHRWQDIWLNEGFATYAEWLWSQHEGISSVQSLFEQEYANSPDAVWRTPPGDPGRDDIFSRSVYHRGAMALQALRLTVGDDAFFRVLKTWAAEKRNGNATTAEFMTLAERISGKSLGPLFDAWLYAPAKPPVPGR